MNRLIKFRGLRTDGKGWVYGGVVYPNRLLKGVYIVPDVNTCDFYPDQKDDEFDPNAEHHGITIGRFLEVIPESVGQFTGRQDINGVDVYEGDKVKRQVYDWKAALKEEERTGDLDVIVYKTEESYIEYRDKGFYVKDEYYGWEGEGLWNWSEIEIIGTIHEGKEDNNERH